MCGSTTVKLSIADIERSTTPSPITQAGPQQNDHLQSIGNEFKRSLDERPLTEIPIYTEDELPSHLRFLGTHQDMPFLLVKAGSCLNTKNTLIRSGSISSCISAPNLTEDDTSFNTREPTSSFTSFGTVNSIALQEDASMVASTIYHHDDHESPFISLPNVHELYDGKECPATADKVNARTPISASTEIGDRRYKEAEALRSRLLSSRRRQVQQELKPQALCLTVQLSKKSFLPNPYRKVKKVAVLDVKIDVYFNGELCASAYVPERYRGEKSIAELTQRFGGRRIERLLERPWVIVPNGQNADGSLREHKRSKGGYAGAQQRWNAVSEMLKVEAEKGGRNKWGELSVLGDYLESLSKLEMPKEVDELQRPGGVKYGIIDVVLTTGHGRKDDSNVGYLSEPTSIRTSDLRASIPSVVSQQLQAGANRLSFKAMQRRKTNADAEIIASGYCGSVGPRQNTRSVVPTKAALQPLFQPVPSTMQLLHQVPILVPTISKTGHISATRNAASPASALPSNGELFPTPNAPSTAPSAARRRQSRPVQKLRLSQPARPVQTRPEPMPNPYTNDLALVKSHPRATSRRLSKGSDAVPLVAMAKNSTLKRKSSDENLGLYSDFFLPQTPQSTRRSTYRHVTTPFRGRERSSRGHFIKSPSGPHSASRTGRPQNVPQKRYKGADRASEDDGDEAIEEELYTGKERKRSRMNYVDVMTNKLTVSEEIAAIAEKAALGAGSAQKTGEGETDTPLPPTSGSRILRRRFANLSAVPSPSPAAVSRPPSLKPIMQIQSQPAAPSTPANSGHILTLRLPSPFLATLANRPRTPPSYPSIHSSPSISPLTSLGVLTPGSALSPERSCRRRPEIGPDDAPYSNTPASRARAKAKPRAQWRPKAVETALQAWQPGALNEDCVVTYSKDLIRQVKAERTGWFRESGVLMGVRFLVG
ncbi:hypothetical protein MMC13_005119 [Lambiella insularis]|nr:hypothetical protein [Lambiella insularis]